MTSKLSPYPGGITLKDFVKIKDSASKVVEQARTAMLAPTSKKQAPVFTTAEVAELCGVDRNKVEYAMKKGIVASPEKNGARTEWSLRATRELVRHFNPDRLRDADKSDAVVITIANFKGGVSKTTTTATLAQGLSLRGLKCLVIDLDAQASLTTLFSFRPETEVEDSDTFMSIVYKDETSLSKAIRPTYWDGIDIVCASLSLYSAEFILPALTSEDRTFSFWTALDKSLDQARKDYDVILIDTSPSLGYVTINAFMAADGIVMPMAPSALDFASSAQFWNLITETLGAIKEQRGFEKRFGFVDVLLSRVDKADNISIAIRQWINAAYSIHVLPVEIPKTSIAATASAEFGTVYDIKSGTVQAKTLKRAKDAYDSMVFHVELQIRDLWNARIAHNSSKE